MLHHCNNTATSHDAVSEISPYLALVPYSEFILKWRNKI